MFPFCTCEICIFVYLTTQWSKMCKWYTIILILHTFYQYCWDEQLPVCWNLLKMSKHSKGCAYLFTWYILTPWFLPLGGNLIVRGCYEFVVCNIFLSSRCLIMFSRKDRISATKINDGNSIHAWQTCTCV